MTPDEYADALAKGIAAGNTVTNNLLFGLVAIALLILIVVLYSSLKTNAILMQFIMNMGGRSTAANEQSGAVGQANTEALSSQARTLNEQSGTLGDIDVNVKTALAVLDVLGLDVDTLAKHASKPTAATQDKVDQLADKAIEKDKLE